MPVPLTYFSVTHCIANIIFPYLDFIVGVAVVPLKPLMRHGSQLIDFLGTDLSTMASSMEI